MNSNDLKDFQKIFKYFPLVGVSIAELAKKIGIGYTTLYNYRNGLRPKKERYNYIMQRIKEQYPKELQSIALYIQVDKELEKAET